MLSRNVFQDCGTLREREAQGDASVKVALPEQEGTLAEPLATPEASAAPGWLFQARNAA